MTAFDVDMAIAGRAMLWNSTMVVEWFESAAESDDLISSRLLKTS